MDTLVIHSGNPGSHPDLSEMLPKGSKIHYLDMAAYQNSNVQKQDIIIAFHSLQTVEARDIPKVMLQMASDLNLKGELRIYVPALEWAMAQAAETDPSPAFHAVMYGPADFPSRSAFTLQWLRTLVESTGLVTRQARHEPMELQSGSGSIIMTSMNLVIGWKLEETESAKDAIK